MSTTIAPGAAAGSCAAPAREQATGAPASRAGQAQASAPRSDNHVIVESGCPVLAFTGVRLPSIWETQSLSLPRCRSVASIVGQ